MARQRKTSEDLIALARKLGVEVTITTKPQVTGEIAPMPGIRKTEEKRRAELLTDDDGSGVVE